MYPFLVSFGIGVSIQDQMGIISGIWAAAGLKKKLQQKTLNQLQHDIGSWAKG